MSTYESFLTVSNIQNLIIVFNRFLKDRYSLEDTAHLNVKKIMYETMLQIRNEKSSDALSVVELNKITLSVVKNVVKNNLFLDKTFNGSLTRDRDVNTKSSAPFGMFSRPEQSTSVEKNANVMSEYEQLMQNRQEEKKTGTDEDPIRQFNLDNAFSPDEFMGKLESLQTDRAPNDSVLPFPPPSNAPTMDVNLEDMYKSNITNHPKELYTSTLQTNIESTFESSLTNPGNVPAPPKKDDRELKTAYIVVDSRNRDMTKYPFPSDYVIDFENILRNVESIELVYALYNNLEVV